MPKWVLEDDCLTPSAKTELNYNGQNPLKIYKDLKPRLQKIFDVGSKDVWERDYRWDITEDPRSFFIRVYVDKALDQRSSLLIEIVFQGKQPSNPLKEGNMVIRINGTLKTEYEIPVPVYKSLWWLYTYLFYGKVRRGYLILCNDWIETLIREFRTFLSMPNP